MLIAFEWKCLYATFSAQPRSTSVTPRMFGPGYYRSARRRCIHCAPFNQAENWRPDAGMETASCRLPISRLDGGALYCMELGASLPRFYFQDDDWPESFWKEVFASDAAKLVVNGRADFGSHNTLNLGCSPCDFSEIRNAGNGFSCLQYCTVIILYALHLWMDTILE